MHQTVPVVGRDTGLRVFSRSSRSTSKSLFTTRSKWLTGKRAARFWKYVILLSEPIAHAYSPAAISNIGREGQTPFVTPVARSENGSASSEMTHRYPHVPSTAIDKSTEMIKTVAFLRTPSPKTTETPPPTVLGVN